MKKEDVTKQGNQYCNNCKEITWHTPKLGLVLEGRRVCSICNTSNKTKKQ